jgi:hypothetical protein
MISQAAEVGAHVKEASQDEVTVEHSSKVM